MMTNAKSTLRLIIPALLLLLAAGCTTPFKANVARFQQMAPPQGESFTVVPADPALVGSIEFNQYASLVAQRLQTQGYTPASDAAQADLVVSFDYIVDGGRERVRTTPGVGGFGWGGGFGPWGPGFGRFGWGGWGWGGPGFWGPGFGGWGWGGGFGPDVRSYTIYNSELDLTIDRVADNQRVFEGRAMAVSRSNNLTYLVPNLVEAMFAEFPGNSGETVRVSLDDDKIKVKTLNRTARR